ncbi:MAG: hypothetical protein ACP5JJ_13960 [Anaerolineae bacterium]
MSGSMLLIQEGAHGGLRPSRRTLQRADQSDARLSFTHGTHGNPSSISARLHLHDDANDLVGGGVLQHPPQIWLDGPWSIGILRVSGPAVSRPRRRELCYCCRWPKPLVKGGRGWARGSLVLGYEGL